MLATAAQTTRAGVGTATAVTSVAATKQKPKQRGLSATHQPHHLAIHSHQQLQLLPHCRRSFTHSSRLHAQRPSHGVAGGSPSLDLPGQPMGRSPTTSAAAASVHPSHLPPSSSASDNPFTFDPSNPSHAIPPMPKGSRRFIRVGLTLAVVLGVYHFDILGARKFVDERLAGMANEKDEKPKKPNPFVRATIVEAETPSTPNVKPVVRQTEPVVRQTEEKKSNNSNKPTNSSRSSASASASAATIANSALSSTPPSTPTPAATPEPVDKLRDTMEMLELLQLQQQLKQLLDLERRGYEVPSAVADDVSAIADNVYVPMHPLPATEALSEIEKVSTLQKLPAVELPRPPRWLSPPTTAEEARERVQALKEFKAAYERAISNYVSSVSWDVETMMRQALTDKFHEAEQRFDEQLPARLTITQRSTMNTLESSEMVERAEIMNRILSNKSLEWSKLFGEELEKHRAMLEQQTERVLAQQQKHLHAKFEPQVLRQLDRLAAQRRDVQRLEKELNRAAQVEKEGQIVHQLTNILISMEELLQNDDNKPLFQAVGQDRPAPSPSHLLHLTQEWSQLRQVASSSGDKELNAIVSSVAEDWLGEDVSQPLLSRVILTREFQGYVEPQVRQATFLPEHADQHSWTARLYAKLFSTLALKEGHALRPVSRTDADRLNNATYFINHSNLDAAVKELESMSPPARHEARQWINQAKQRIQVEQAVQNVRKQAERLAADYRRKTKDMAI